MQESRAPPRSGHLGPQRSANLQQENTDSKRHHKAPPLSRQDSKVAILLPHGHRPAGIQGLTVLSPDTDTAVISSHHGESISLNKSTPPLKPATLAAITTVYSSEFHK